MLQAVLVKAKYREKKRKSQPKCKKVCESLNHKIICGEIYAAKSYKLLRKKIAMK